MFSKVESKLVASSHMKPQSSSEQVSKLSVEMSQCASGLAGSRWGVIALTSFPCL